MRQEYYSTLNVMKAEHLVKIKKGEVGLKVGHKLVCLEKPILPVLVERLQRCKSTPSYF